jgi:PKD repeat protein
VPVSGATFALGTTTVSCSASDTSGNSASGTFTVSVYNTQPIASFTVSPNPSACGQPVAFNANGSSPSRPTRPIVSYRWTFGDNQTSTTATPSASHPYSAFGSYTATLVVVDNAGFNSTPATRTINVSDGNQAPVSNPGGPYTVALGNSITLNGSSSFDPNVNCGDSIVSYAWTIDGTIHLSGPSPTLSTAINPLTIGSHPISLIVTDTFGLTSTATTTVNVTQNRPVLTLKVNGQHPNPPVVITTGPMTLTLDISASQYTAPLSWYWGLIVNNQLIWITATGLSATPTPLVVSPPVAIAGATLLNVTLPPATTLTSFFVLVDSGGVAVAFDWVTATRP